MDKLFIFYDNVYGCLKSYNKKQSDRADSISKERTNQLNDPKKKLAAFGEKFK